MNFFQLQKPILQKKQLSLDESQLKTLKCITLNFHKLLRIPLCGIYTCIDQAMIIWGIISAIIFITAQFFPISWINQAIIWSIVTLIGMVLTVLLTYSWTKLEGLSWLLYLWVGLMFFGILITDLAIAFGWGLVLCNLCNLWLFVSVVGYVITGLGLKSRAFFLSAIIHSVTILILPLCMGWQFFLTGLVMASNLIIFSEGQWDMILVKDTKKNYIFNNSELIFSP